MYNRFEETTLDDMNAVWRGTRLDFTLAEIRGIARRFEWGEFWLHSDKTRMSVHRKVILSPSHRPPCLLNTRSDDDDWRLEDEHQWLETYGDRVKCVQVIGQKKDNYPPVEIHKGRDDWFWVVLDGHDIDFYWSSPAGHPPHEYWKCDGMRGLLAMLEWAFPMDVCR